MTTHTLIEQLTAWYVGAERVTTTNLPNPGDTLIYPADDGYVVTPASDGWEPSIALTDDPVRILHRAPKPKPAWHDAVAILARNQPEEDQPKRTVWTWHESMGRWDDEGGCHWANTEDLRDVTPLIEAKVTDEMVERVESRFNEAARASLPTGLARRILTAALGLDPA